jgi:hypothetical protein
MPALKVNIIIVHPWDVVWLNSMENNIPRAKNYDVYLRGKKILKYNNLECDTL